MRKRFDEQLLQVRGMLKEMCEVDAEAMRLIERALASREDVSAPVRACERAADEKEREIERLCMRVKMVTDLERITDQAADIADILKGAVSCAVPKSLGAMMASAREMVERCAAALDTFTKPARSAAPTMWWTDCLSLSSANSRAWWTRKTRAVSAQWICS